MQSETHLPSYIDCKARALAAPCVCVNCRRVKATYLALGFSKKINQSEQSVSVFSHMPRKRPSCYREQTGLGTIDCFIDFMYRMLGAKATQHTVESYSWLLTQASLCSETVYFHHFGDKYHLWTLKTVSYLYIFIEIQCIYVHLIFIILPHLHVTPWRRDAPLCPACLGSHSYVPMALVGKIYHESWMAENRSKDSILHILTYWIILDAAKRLSTGSGQRSGMKGSRMRASLHQSCNSESGQATSRPLTPETRCIYLLSFLSFPYKSHWVMLAKTVHTSTLTCSGPWADSTAPNTWGCGRLFQPNKAAQATQMNKASGDSKASNKSRKLLKLKLCRQGPQTVETPLLLGPRDDSWWICSDGKEDVSIISESIEKTNSQWGEHGYYDHRGQVVSCH